MIRVRPRIKIRSYFLERFNDFIDANPISKHNPILRNRERLSYSFRNYNLLRSKSMGMRLF